MSQPLSELVYQELMPKHSETENFCGFSLPFIFQNGTPIALSVERIENGKLRVSDNGINLIKFCQAYGVDQSDAEQIFASIEVELSLNIFSDGAILVECEPHDLCFVLINYFVFFGRLVAFDLVAD